MFAAGIFYMFVGILLTLIFVRLHWPLAHKVYE